MDKDKNKSFDTVESEKGPENVPEFPSWAEEAEDDTSKTPRFMLRGTDMAKVPCFKSSLMYSIGSGMLVGLAYNLGTSRPPGKIAFGTYAIVFWGSWFYCRFDLRRRKFLAYKAAVWWEGIFDGIPSITRVTSNYLTE